ncbi:peptidoglycan-binding protein [Amycolatopsis sp. 195334CR]|uniref:peptidoglycan-binding domain-containing protein n=1 Tax=Amycolatopsis sp. 195334CR TaxID=2814588 RepID=UPI001A8CC706|nr:peptidoglycan-binding domain-containing protein [Amycolatopsis sp. 195334CR]MBN6034812.1 peptidoglycan-binding protein [Amycolatopsis sp. 195334CR]
MRRFLVTAAVLATAFGLAPATASADFSAAATTCDGVKRISIGNNYIRQPVHTGGAGRNCQLAYGDSGSAVTALQQALRLCNQKANISADGDFGDLTRKALAYAQYKAGVDDDGIYGPVTRGALGWPAYNGNGFTGACAKDV